VVVEGEFGDGEEVGPVVLMPVGVGAEEVFEDLVGALDLAVSLWVVGGGEVAARAHEFKGTAPKAGGEGGCAIGGQVVGETKRADDVEKEEVGEVGGGGCFVAGYDLDHLGEVVDDDEDGVKAVGLG
jgi:hypothetical protein